MKTDKRMLKPRNHFHAHPLMRRGGIHEKTNKAKRKSEKQKLEKEWCFFSYLLIKVIKKTPLYGLVA